MSSWNFVGIIAWIIVIALLIFVVFNIRNRHLKILVQQKKKITGVTILTDLLEIVVVILAVSGMLYTSLFTKVDLNDKDNIVVSYKYNPMIVQTTNDGQGYYVKINKQEFSSSTDVYQYWLNNSKYTVSSQNATVSDATLPFTVSGLRLNWPVKKIKKLDSKYQDAYVITMQAKYKNNFRNGLGLKANRFAMEYRVLRVPASSFINVEK
ncbi:LVIS_2131 family protein [Companilactobacillus paralimentarius]|uniref:LVIS_2131 family protein n=1 Tax=Companilactobacillus paralimentarius TaxID=83526 RepID=UPI0028532F9F|nr:LVIS_2131 family protein [Companilactobacillus paralimentarius]MDR4932737.1 LVIS_2131 family protein [Companilactobacillus paralimentarius]